MAGRLSTCATCHKIIEWENGDGWAHRIMPRPWHDPEPDDSHVSGPSHNDVCDGADPECEHPDCEDRLEAERALDDDADAYFDRLED